MELRYRDGDGNWRWARQAGIAVRGARMAERIAWSAPQATSPRPSAIDEAMTASADLLKVMSRSTFELQTVLDTAVNSATRLCDADAALIFRREAQHFGWRRNIGLTPEQHEILARSADCPPGAARWSAARRWSAAPSIFRTCSPTTEYHWPEVDQESAAIAAMLGVPLMREGEPIGVITLTRDTRRGRSAPSRSS